jgi:hypothetical protein
VYSVRHVDEDLVRVVGKYLRNNPERLNLPASVLVNDALMMRCVRRFRANKVLPNPKYDNVGRSGVSSE